MKFIRLVVFALFLCPFVARAAAVTEFTVASQLLAAARNADIQQVQALVAGGANINFIDGTGLSLVCTALMNNDLRAAQILQMYGADASKCDQQIRKYRTRRAPERTGGLFGGLSTAQGMILAAAGAAVVVGGLFLLTDVFDPDNDNGYAGSGAGSGSGGGGGDTTGTGVPLFASGLPYGPLLPSASAESKNYAENLSYYAPADTTSILYKNFQYMNQNENYLLLMHGYSPLARGYLGMRTLRDSSTYAPLSLSGYNLGNDPVEGGRPVNVALITANGVNAAAGTSLEDKLVAWTTNAGPSSLNPASNTMVSSKYYNNKITTGTDGSSMEDDTTAEDFSLLGYFDWSNSGTAVYNGLATDVDNMLGKIVAGNTAGYTNPDFFGFMPNGQMAIYRTGGGTRMVTLATPVNAGTYSGTALATGGTVNLFNETLTANVVGSSVVLSNETSTYNGYIGTDGLLYIDSNGDGKVDVAYIMSSGNLVQSKELQNTDYYNYSAMVDAAGRAHSGDLSGGRSKVDIIANASVIEPLHLTDAATIETVLASGATNYATTFGNLVANAYGATDTSNLPQTNATSFFNSLGSSYSPLTIFSTGGSVTDANWSASPLAATFENAAPLVYQNLEHLFMSVVAVGASTADATSILANSDTNAVPYQLAQWAVADAAAGTTTYYKSRVCGVAGTGGNGIDPWCFAAVGVTDEMAVAAAAGAAGVLTSAFYYMTPQQIFMLLALTADGPSLGRLSSGQTLTESALASYLQSMYQMPESYQFRIDNGENYFDVFREVFGYGVINLERATTPGTNLYFYSGGDIVSTSGNAYWRAASTTGFRGSAALNLGRAAISTAAYDILENIDGTMRLPRIWKNDFALGGGTRHALYMGDVLGDLRVRAHEDNMVRIGNMALGFTRSAPSYDDSMGGIDNMRFEYANDSWKIAADYQRYLTDAESRFSGVANPILALASNAISTSADYKYGNLFFGARAISGAITDEGLLANDPTVSANYEPMKLGNFSAVQSSVGLRAKKFGLTTSVGVARESDTLLGASGTGLLGLGASETHYFDTDAYWNLSDSLRLRARATFAHTVPGVDGGAIISLSPIDSNAFSFGADYGGLSLGVSMPLAVRHGKMYYDYADYDIITDEDGMYDLVVSNAGVRDIDIRPDVREVRFNASYRHKIGEFTDGAIGFIYRVNPNNTREFGNESIFMLKMSHWIGI
ncbi:MAG: ankyrin repeat domain-containing protein [Alphaproteobacteria bacterium]|nr:ankyrin repeat domain-containing protein [Alphaproteobacteria bacterium]